MTDALTSAVRKEYQFRNKLREQYFLYITALIEMHGYNGKIPTQIRCVVNQTEERQPI